MFQKLKQVTLREEQTKCVELFKNTDKKYLCVELVTGSGKSILGMKIADMLIEREINIENNLK